MVGPQDEVIVNENDPLIATTKHADGTQSVTIGVEQLETDVNMHLANGQEKLVVPPQHCPRCGVSYGFVFGVRNDTPQAEIWLVCTNCGQPVKSLDKLREEAAALQAQMEAIGDGTPPSSNPN